MAQDSNVSKKNFLQKSSISIHRVLIKILMLFSHASLEFLSISDR